MAIDVTINAPTPGMKGRELDQWNQRIYEALRQVIIASGGSVVITDHNDLENNGGDNSHASITSHISSDRAHGTSSDVVGVADPQKLYNKEIDADDNTISNLRHGEEVDEPAAAHGVTEIIGSQEAQVISNKKIIRTLTPIDASVYLMKETDDVITCLSQQQTLINLTTAIGNSGRVLTIDNANLSEAIQIRPLAGEKIEGETSQRLPKQSSFTIISDGATWRVI